MTLPSTMRFVNNNKFAIFFSLLFVFISAVTVFCFFPTLLIAISMGVIASVCATLMVITIIWSKLDSEIKEKQNVNSLLELEWKEFNEITSEALSDKKEIDLRHGKLMKRAKDLNRKLAEENKKNLTTEDLGFFSNPLSLASHRQLFIDSETSAEIKKLFASYPQVEQGGSHVNTQEVKKIKNEFFEHHTSVKNLVYPFLDQLERRLEIAEAEYLTLVNNANGESSTQQLAAGNPPDRAYGA